MKKQILCLLLASAAAMSACAGSSDDSASTTAQSESSDTSTAEAEEELSDNLGSFDFGGDEFNIYTRAVVFGNYNLDTESETGELINDSVYKRNRLLEDRFNFVMKEDYYDYIIDGNDAPRKLLLAGDTTYDMYVGRCVHMFNYASEGMLHKISDLPYIDTSRPYWDDQLYNDLSVCGEHYFAVGAFNLTSYDYTHVMLFNKGLTETLMLESPYELVRSGKWTYDKFNELASAALYDLNGDSVMDAEDRYGYSSHTKQVLPDFWISAGAVTISKDNDGKLFFSAPTDTKFIEVYQKIFEITRENNVWYPAAMAVDFEEELRPFRNNQSLFADSSAHQITTIRDSEVDFGIIPYPKWDENQKNYCSRIEGCELFGIPLTSADTEMASVILEAMACESLKNVVPAYYDTALKVKYTRDNESADMLDLIFSNRIFDYGDTILCTELRDGIFWQAYFDNKNDVVSLLASKTGIIDSALKKYNAAFEKLAG